MSFLEAVTVLWHDFRVLVLWFFAGIIYSLLASIVLGAIYAYYNLVRWLWLGLAHPFWPVIILLTVTFIVIGAWSTQDM